MWLRSGLAPPAAEESWRSEILACSGCGRCNSPMEPTFTGFTLAVNQIALAIANAPKANTGAWARLAPQASPAREVGSGLVRYQADPDSAYPLASPIHGDVRDPGQGIPVHPLGTVRADGSQQRDRDRRDGPGRAVLDLHRPGPAVGQGERLHPLRPGLD